jgi:adenine deaminase
MNVGLLKPGDPADFIIVENLKDFKVHATYINGALVAENGISKIKTQPALIINNFNCDRKEVSEFKLPVQQTPPEVIEAIEGQLITNKLSFELKIENSFYISDVKGDILKMVVVNRYQNAPVAKAFVKNFGLKRGAIASSVAHDSHNIIAVGADDESIADAVNSIIDAKGGISVADHFNSSFNKILALPVAGLMSIEDGYKVAELYTEIDSAVKELGSRLSAPFMTLSFMALLVIPHLKLSDKGLFDGDTFRLVNGK